MNLLWWNLEDFNQISSKIYNTKNKQEYISKWHPENLRKITLCPNIFQEYSDQEKSLNPFTRLYPSLDNPERYLIKKMTVLNRYSPSPKIDAFS